MDLSYYLVIIISAIIELFLTPLWIGKIVFLLITIGLPLVGIYKKMIRLVYASIIILIVFFLVNFHFVPLFPHYISAVQSSIIVSDSFLLKSTYNFGLILIPLIFCLIALRFSKK